ncbi:MAG: tetratricopeptide repeat protein [Candidatus Riflebacteria bacterium]|nr:tetratricopeptide repeat protein [Candidatus Riflebacteria bacterium]
MSTDVSRLLEEGNLAFTAKKYEQALMAYERALERSPDDPVVLNKIGIAYYKLRKFPEAIDNLLKALTLKPNDKDLLNTLGLVYAKSGDRQKALSICERLRKIHPEKGEALYKAIYE